MKYKYRLNHNVSLPSYALSISKYAAIAALDCIAKPYHSESKLVFIAGCGHSGTTLLAARFGNLAKTFVVPKETYEFRPENPLYAIRHELDTWIKHSKQIDAETVIEKTPKHIHCWHRIKAFIPAAKLVVITRGPLDTCASLAKRYGDLAFATERYCIDNLAAAKLRKAKDVYHMSYEAFVTQPDIEGKKLVEFTGQQWREEFVAGGTSTYDAADLKHNMLLRQQQVREPIRANVGGWKQQLTSEQAKFVLDKTSYVASLLGHTSGLAERPISQE